MNVEPHQAVPKPISFGCDSAC